MAIYQILGENNPTLREKCKKVPKVNSNIIKLLENMADTMYAAEGVGLAAPQIGITKRVVVIDVGEGLIELINPVIISKEGEETDAEGCLSLPGVAGEVTRAARVKVKALDRNGKEQEYTGEGLLARAFQHEVDHLDGILFIDLAKRIQRRK